MICTLVVGASASVSGDCDISNHKSKVVLTWNKGASNKVEI